MSEHWSKSLGHSDESGFAFSRELLAGDQTAAINFDRLQKHPVWGYVILEYLLCQESQHVTPYSSHPRRYWNQNAAKFLSLWRVACDLNARLLLVNYAKKGTRAEQEVLLIEVLDMDETGITRERQHRFTRDGFSHWFRALNAACLSDPTGIAREIYRQKGPEYVGRLLLKDGPYRGQSIEYVFRHDRPYLERMAASHAAYSTAALYYLEEKDGGSAPF